MAQTATKLEYPTGQDPFAPDRDMKKLAESATVIVPVANRAEADDIANQLDPAPEQPLIVYRSDIKAIESYDGTKWGGVRLEDTGWVKAVGRGGYYHSTYYRIVNGMVAFSIYAECASTRAPGTVEDFVSPVAGLDLGDQQLWFQVWHMPGSGSAGLVRARVFKDGHINLHGAPQMAPGDLIYGYIFFPIVGFIDE